MDSVKSIIQRYKPTAWIPNVTRVQHSYNWIIRFPFIKDCQDQHKGTCDGSYLGTVHFHNRRINRLRRFGISASHHVMLTWDHDHHQRSSKVLSPRLPEVLLCPGDSMRMQFSTRLPDDECVDPDINYGAQDGALDRRSWDPSNRGPGFEPSNWSIKSRYQSGHVSKQAKWCRLTAVGISPSFWVQTWLIKLNYVDMNSCKWPPFKRQVKQHSR